MKNKKEQKSERKEKALKHVTRITSLISIFTEAVDNVFLWKAEEEANRKAEEILQKQKEKKKTSALVFGILSAVGVLLIGVVLFLLLK